MQVTELMRSGLTEFGCGCVLDVPVLGSVLFACEPCRAHRDLWFGSEIATTDLIARIRAEFGERRTR